MPEWLKGADCKSAGYAYVGSNPTRPRLNKNKRAKHRLFSSPGGLCGWHGPARQDSALDTKELEIGCFLVQPFRLSLATKNAQVEENANIRGGGGS